MNVLGVSTLLFGNNLQFNANKILAVLNPVLDILFWFSKEFFFRKLKNSVLGVLWEAFSSSVDSMDLRHHVWWKVFSEFVVVIIPSCPYFK